MKKEYKQPQLWSDNLFINCRICDDSPQVTGGDNGTGDIGYGGVDEEGEIDPGAKPIPNAWETGLW